MADLTMLMELCKIWHSAISAASHAHTHTPTHIKAQGVTMCVNTEDKEKDERAVRHCLGDQE